MNVLPISLDVSDPIIRYSASRRASVMWRMTRYTFAELALHCTGSIQSWGLSGAVFSGLVTAVAIRCTMKDTSWLVA